MIDPTEHWLSAKCRIQNTTVYSQYYKVPIYNIIQNKNTLQ